MECRLLQVVHVSPKALGGSIVLGEVLRFHIADEIFDDYRIDPDRLRAIGEWAVRRTPVQRTASIWRDRKWCVRRRRDRRLRRGTSAGRASG